MGAIIISFSLITISFSFTYFTWRLLHSEVVWSLCDSGQAFFARRIRVQHIFGVGCQGWILLMGLDWDMVVGITFTVLGCILLIGSIATYDTFASSTLALLSLIVEPELWVVILLYQAHSAVAD